MYEVFLFIAIIVMAIYGSVLVYRIVNGIKKDIVKKQAARNAAINKGIKIDKELDNIYKKLEYIQKCVNRHECYVGAMKSQYQKDIEMNNQNKAYILNKLELMNLKLDALGEMLKDSNKLDNCDASMVGHVYDDTVVAKE